MAYAILRFQKHKGGASKALSAHHERTKESYASNPDIDRSRSDGNFHLVTPRWSYEQEIKHRIQVAGCKVRKDSVKFVDTMVAVSPEFAKKHESEMREFFVRAFNFLQERVGQQNIISAVIHLDEKTPHMHLCFVPLTIDGRLSAKEILGNKKAMIQWQDDFYACMAERWPELQRGTPAVETKRKHLPTQWYKRATVMDEKLEQMEQALSDINVFNAGKKREAAMELLAQLLPEVESFRAEVNRMQQKLQMSQLETKVQQSEKEKLMDDLATEKSKSFEKSCKLAAMESRCRKAEKLLSQLPPEMIQQLRKPKEHSRE